MAELDPELIAYLPWLVSLLLLLLGLFVVGMRSRQLARTRDELAAEIHAHQLTQAETLRVHDKPEAGQAELLRTRTDHLAREREPKQAPQAGV